MAANPDRPVLFLAFANDRAEEPYYLRNLAKESRQIRRALRTAPYAYTYEIVHEDHARLEEIIDFFQAARHRDRTVLFHFGGHADSYRLLIEQNEGGLAIMDAAALARFLAQQSNLRFVFLNACATQAQVQGLLDAGVQAVIATRCRVDDALATAFAARFYNGLANGATLEGAYNEAVDAISAASEQFPRHLRPMREDAGAEMPPWQLSTRPGADGVRGWTLLDLTRLSPWPTLDDLPLDLVPDVGPLPPGSRLELAPNPLFVGREKELRILAATLKPGNTVAITTATGTGGIGKTQLAVEFAHRYGRYFSGGVFWLSFADPAAIPAEVVRCGLTMPNLDADFASAPQEDQVRLVRQAWQAPIPRLLIFDNCETPSIMAAWRPVAGGCRILVTSRHTTWPATYGVASLSVETLARAQSLELLHKFSVNRQPPSPPFTTDEEPLLDKIAAELGDLPLALHLAGSYLARYRYEVSLASFLTQLCRPDLLQHKGLTSGEDSPTGHELHVARTFALSYDRLGATDPLDSLARRTLACAACFALGEPIPRALLRQAVERGPIQAATTDPTVFSDALGRLTDLGLLDMENDGTVRLHRLIARFVQQTNSMVEAQGSVEQVIITEAYKQNRAGYPATLLAWQTHLRTVTDQALARKDERSATLSTNLGYHLNAIGELAAAKPYFEQALAIRQRVLGELHPHTANSLNNLGYLLHAQGELAAARSYFEQTLAIRQQVLGELHPDTAQSLNNLGFLLHAQGQFEEARPYFEQALAIRQRVLGKRHPTTASSLNNLGYLLHAQGQFEEARSYYEQALAIRQRVLGKQHPTTAKSLNNLGVLLKDQGELAAARPYFEQALAIRQQVLGEQHPDTAQSLNNLGFLLHAQDEFEKAKSYLEQALAINRQVLGKQHPTTVFSLNNLGFLLHAQGEFEKARSYLEQALPILGPRLGSPQSYAQIVRNNLATRDAV